LSRYPSETNWSFLLRSLPILEGATAREVLVKLRSVNLAPEEPEYFRQVILQGLALKEHGAADAVALLEYWTERRENVPAEDWQAGIQGWQKWYAEKWPTHLPAELPQKPESARWEFDDLLNHLTSEDGAHGNPAKGAEIYAKAQCAKCHRFGNVGESGGPDLSSVSKRFMRKEILHAILYPSHIVSDQYRAKTVITDKGRQYTGIVAPAAAGEITILLPDGKKITLAEKEIDETVPSKISVMPQGLLDTLTLEEISHLFAFLGAVPDTRLVQRPTSATNK
jgi:putative heme-binding domain-containing protein